MIAPGKGLIKVSSILYIVIGGIMSLLGLISIVGFSKVKEAISLLMNIDIGVYFVMLLLQTANYAMALVIGILGVVNAALLEKANFLFNFGIAVAILQATNFIGQFSIIGFNIVDSLTLALPIFFLMGAQKNKQAYTDQWKSL